MNKNRAIEILKRKLAEIPHLRTLSLGNEEFELWRTEVIDILETRFGKDSTEYGRFLTAVGVLFFAETAAEKQKEYNRRLDKYETALKSIVRKTELSINGEKSAVMVEPIQTAELTVHLFDKMQFHPKVIEASRELFKDGHYRDAIYRAFVEVNNYVKGKANSQLDGKKLMSTVFSLEKPIIKLNSLQTQSDRDEQEGFMFLFMGAMEGIRNPKAHENIIQNDPYKSLEYIGFASLLMKTIDFWEAGTT